MSVIGGLAVFMHGEDAAGAVRDFYALTGPTPMLPRWALGNWWSRYHPYSEEEYLALLDRFAAARLPFSVAVLDMDWHLTDVDPVHGSGWTGYTWDPDLFPDPGGPVTPTRYARPVLGKIRRISSVAAGDSSSISEIARATARASPSITR